MRDEQLKTPMPMIAFWSIAGLGAIVIAALLVPPAGAQAPDERPGHVDYPGFRELTSEVSPHRAARLVDLDTFNAMKADPDTLVIDARSAEAYAMGHIAGAINLNFADFTDARLAELVGSTDRRILIYCNNNFTDNVEPVVLKRAPLALNIATYINLYGYGYTNVYELDGAYSFTDPRMNWVSSLQKN